MSATKKFTICPDHRYRGQEVHIQASISGDKEEIWINPHSTRESNSVCLSAEEAVEFAKMLYRAAYAMGYKKGESS